MKTKFITDKEKELEFESREVKGGFETRTTLKPDWTFSKNILPEPKTPNRVMNQTAWHTKLRKYYLSRKWKLIEGTVIPNVDVEYNTFDVNEN